MLLSYSRKELSGLATLRVLLAVYLMMFHTIPHYGGLPEWVYEIVHSGYMATSLFFLLSGFILSHVYLSGGGLRITPAEFLRTRFLTLYPIHLIGLLLSGAILLVQWKMTGSFNAVVDLPTALTNETTEAVRRSLDGAEIMSSLVSHLMLTHAWNPYYLTFNVPSWSISALIFFYVVFLWQGQRIASVRRPLVFLLVLNVVYLLPPLILVAQGQYNSVAAGFLHTNPLVRLPEFLAGIVLYRLMRKINHIHLGFGQFCFALAASCTLLFLVDDALWLLGSAGYYLAHNGGLLLVQCLVLVLFAGVREFRTPWLHRAVKRMGNASLSMFILHLPLFFLFTRLEKLIHVLLLGDWQQPLWPQIKEMEPVFAVYPVIVVAVMLISVWCQESVVIKLRSFLSERLRSHNSAQNSRV